MQTNRYWLAPLLAGTLLLPACMHTEETVHREAERMKVEFETEQAARIFHEGLSKTPLSKRSREQKTEFHIPLVIHTQRTEIVSENVAFNDAVRRCDTNQDGKITEMEARIFAEHP